MSDPMLDRLGYLYLGRRVTPETFLDGDPLHFDSRRLTTHGVIVGMTGSGKTGLGISLLEEAALDGVPAIVVDPKGDLSNLLLTFPDLAGKDFEPWVDPDEATRKGMTPAALGEAEAKKWREGLAGWGIEPARIAALRNAADFTIWTPGSEAGEPLALVRPLSPPAGFADAPSEEREERLAGTVAAILSLAGEPPDDRSPETVLLSLLVGNAWNDGKTVALADLVRLVLTPPVTEVGALPLDDFLPPAKRKALAASLTALVASPSLRRWTVGSPLDVAALLRAPSGKPRISVVSIAHLSDTERMFVVTLLATELVAWMRRQSGTSSLRALFYMDELFGYLPPSAMPSSKRPLLTLLKQARAFGLGCVFATQNPVDLDYKALTNAGTWFVGRLAAQRDKDRLLDGLESAAASTGRALDRAALDRAISSLPGRVFVMNDAAEGGASLIRSRWAMSYLRGPLTKEQIALVMKGKKAAPASASVQESAGGAAASPSAAPSAAPVSGAATAGTRPALPPDVPQFFVPLRGAVHGELGWKGMLVGAAIVRFRDERRGVDVSREIVEAVPFDGSAIGVDWERAVRLDVAGGDFEKDAPVDGAFSSVPEAGRSAKKLESLRKSWIDALLRHVRLELFRSAGTGEVSSPGESEAEFRSRIAHSLREKRDAEVDAIGKKWAPKIRTLEDALRRAEAKVEKEKSDVTSAGTSAVIQIGAAVLGAILGRKAVSVSTMTRTASAARSVGQTARQRTEAKQAEGSVEVAKERLDEANEAMAAESEAIAAKYSPEAGELEKVSVAPKKSDVEVRVFGLGWVPVEGLGTAAERAVS